jgi:general secretion pathway protein G
LNRYRLHTKDFPTTDEGLKALMTPPADADESTVTGCRGPYLDTDTLSKDPWGNDYQYEYEGGEFPKIWSWGPDKEDGTDDDISNRSTETSGEEGEFGDMDEDMDIDTDFDSGGGLPEPEL